MKKNLLVVAVAVFAAAVLAQHGEKKMDAGHAMFAPTDMKWVPGPKSLPAGIQMCVVDGDPTKEGKFTMRLKVPANYTVMPHWHPADEHVTVISGVFYMAPLPTLQPVEVLDKKSGKAMPAGGFAVMKAKQAHFAWTGKEGAEIQLHGIGPWAINYLNPNDDPRKSGSQSR